MQVKPLVEAVLAALGVAVLSASACADRKRPRSTVLRSTG